ncbi:DUF4271 domain-containing protein [Candidatus Ornithobacterium hominis]|uniref:DUF4271 domain-containing protein n=1 Tax=Candidatus Ornithobacterium hominis TaxID=2497989 RepID=UPI0024BD064A|nr:DUF4271 domain-containing protein [Candidatus Ornithobacterium hominis]CAI9430400.1 DUF4271 domain-containing protein [Candidatus Ornithobacterium hominis]
MEGILRLTENKDWIFISLLALIGIFIFTRFYFNKYYANLNNLHEFSQVKENFLTFYSIAQLSFLFLISLVILPTFSLRVGAEYYYYPPFVLVFLGLFIWFFFKGFINFLLFSTTGQRETLKDFFHQKLYFLIWFSSIYFALAWLAHYSKIPPTLILYTFLAIFISQQILETHSIFNLLYKKLKQPLYYLFLYLCMLEVLPLIYLYKIW